ncbi:recombinase RecT [Hymenobacter siberiensis]|uniref:recombinase RecT n=1 Tax=Hymenobacter siberiensis TaxID=2848396 RepID=UPI001C1E0C6E|nr:recombinase RecT [Hymenobacter siberiensis]
MAENPTYDLPPAQALEVVEAPSAELQARARYELEQTNDGRSLTYERAALLVKSGILPKTIDTPEKAIAIALNGSDLGISATVAFNNIWILEGKPSLSAGLVTALANRANIRFNWLADKADVIGPVQDEAGNWVEGVVDWKWEVEMMEVWNGQLLKNRMQLLWSECQQSGWVKKDPWVKHPRAMARARLIVQIIRAYRPDVLMGMHSFEEIADSTPGERYRYDNETNATVLR